MTPQVKMSGKPVLGILSVALPIGGLLLLLGALFLAPTEYGFSSNAANAAVALSVFACLIGGLIFGCLGLTRKERPALLSLLGVLLSMTIFILTTA